MARTTIETSAPKKRSGDPGLNQLPPGKKRLAIAATAVLVCSLGVVGWYIATSEPAYQEVPGAPPPETTLLTITNTTQSAASVKVTVLGEATPPAGFKGEGGPVKNPMQIDLEPQQYDQFVFSDSTLLETDAPVEVEIEANVGGTVLKGTFTASRKKRSFINLYDATGAVSFDLGPGVTAK